MKNMIKEKKPVEYRRLACVKGNVMGNDNTYEEKDVGTKLEKFEWDNVWWEQTGDHIKPRVLYIGDSISAGLRRYAQNGSNDEILFDRFGTSKALDNKYFMDSIRIFCLQEERRDLIIFNNGLHGWHLSDTEDYSCYYEKMMNFLLEEYPGTPLVLALTTSVVGERNERVMTRNKVAQDIAVKYNLPVIDLYSASIECFDLISSDGVHFTEEGYKKMAVKILDVIRPILDAGKRR